MVEDLALHTDVVLVAETVHGIDSVAVAHCEVLVLFRRTEMTCSVFLTHILAAAAEVDWVRFD